jgi:hypothetical protein
VEFCVDVLGFFRRNSDSGLSCFEALVVNALLNGAESASGVAFFYRKLGLKLSRNNIRKVLARLREWGLAERSENGEWSPRC